MTTSNSSLPYILAHYLLSLIGIKDNSLKNSDTIEDDLNKALPAIAENPRQDKTLSKLINDGLARLSGHPFTVLLTDERCLGLAKILAKILRVKLIYTKKGEFFNGETGNLTFLDDNDRYAIFMTTITDGMHLLPLLKKIKESAYISVIYTFIDYEFRSTCENLKNVDVEIHSVLTLRTILEVAEAEGLITYEEKAEIEKWLMSFKNESDGFIE